jgi:hypothetical protein
VVLVVTEHVFSGLSECKTFGKQTSTQHLQTTAVTIAFMEVARINKQH